LASSTISGSAVLPVLGPFTTPSNDYYIPNDFIANDMWINGVITDGTAGAANVSWSTPALLVAGQSRISAAILRRRSTMCLLIRECP
jgi:hypothetical protein